jgi:hypothetical protein
MRLSNRAKNNHIQGGIGYPHSWGVYLENVTTEETLDDAMSELKCAV